VREYTSYLFLDEGADAMSSWASSYEEGKKKEESGRDFLGLVLIALTELAPSTAIFPSEIVDSMLRRLAEEPEKVVPGLRPLLPLPEGKRGEERREEIQGVWWH
jgi:hypothetical protein